MERKSNREQAKQTERHSKMIDLTQNILVITLKVKYTKLYHQGAKIIPG